MPSRSELAEQVSAVDWFHSIDLGDGIVTPGRADTSRQLDVLELPRDLTGKTVLDIGAWDGFFSFEAERRGAARVVALDSFSWQAQTGGSKRGFELARSALGSRVEDVEMDVLDITPERLGTFDVVFFLGVLYHMRHPLLALEKVAAVAHDLAIVETHVDLTWTRRPAAAFYPSHELGLDPTNWWGPNPQATAAMCKVAGFRDARIVYGDSTPLRIARTLRRTPRYLQKAARHRARPPEHPTQGRAVIHAYR